MNRRFVGSALGTVILTCTHGAAAWAALNPLAFYHLGEGDSGAVPGGAVTTTVESLGLTPGIDMTPFFLTSGVKYSSDTPPNIVSTRSVAFDGSEEALITSATPWYQGTGGFRWGAEMFIKPDPSLQGTESVFFTNGAQFTLGMTAAGRFFVNSTGPGTTPVKYGDWQHVAFITTGSVWQIYVDGVAQFTTLPNFTYDAPNGQATLGSNNALDLANSYTGLMDEHRIFTWTGSFNPNELLWYQGRAAGDVNEDGMVDAIDYNTWRANVGADLSSLTALQGRALGDVNGDRRIDLADFGVIKANKSPGASFGIPEPATATLLLTGAVAAAAVRRRRRRRPNNCATAAGLALMMLVMQSTDASAQAVWGGGSGNWNDANWSGGTGPGGRPAAGDNIVLPPTTGTLTINNNLGIQFGAVRQEGGLLDVAAAGVLDLAGNFENGRGSATNGGELRIAGQVAIGGELDVAYDVAGKISFAGSGKLTTTGNMDTWWTGAAVVDLNSPTLDISVGSTFYYGPGATINANLSSGSFAPIKVLDTLSLQGGTLNVNFVNGFTPTTANSWTLFDAINQAGAITNVNANGLAPGTRLSIDYTTGGSLGQVVQLNVEETLNLKVDVGAGTMTIENPAPGAAALDIDGYIIRSASNALNPGGFAGLGVAGWLPGTAPSQSAALISETNFNGSLAVAQGGTYPLGAAFNPGGAQDLTLEFHLASGEVLPGSVQYVGTPGFPADFDGNGVVNGADLNEWKTGFGQATGAGKADGDADLDGDVDGADFLAWQRQLGSGSGSIAAIPEPQTLLMLAAAGLAGVVLRRAGK